MKHNGDSKTKVKELRLACYVLGQEKVPSVNSFTLECAHKFIIRTRIPEKGKKGYLKRHKIRLETHNENGLHFTKVRDLTSVLLHQPWIAFDNIHRFFVFEAESHEMLLCVTLLNGTHYLFNLHFKSPASAIQLCDYIEQHKVMSGEGDIQVIPDNTSTEQTVPSTHVINYPTEVNEQPQIVETKTSSQLQVKTDTSNIPTSSEMGSVSLTPQPYPNDVEHRVPLNPYLIGVSEEQEEEERRVLKHYDDIIYAYDRNESTSSHYGTKASRKPSQDSLPSYYKYSDTRKFNTTYSNSARRNPSLNPAVYQFSSLGRPRNRSELPSMLFRDSQRHKILYEDLRFINYGPKGYYETDDGPVFLYVAHMKPSDSKDDVRERENKQPRTRVDLNKLKYPQNSPVPASTFALKESPYTESKSIPSSQARHQREEFPSQKTNRPVYSIPTRREPDVFPEPNQRREYSYIKDNQGKWRESCEMEMKLDFHSEDDNQESSDIDASQPRPRIPRKLDEEPSYHRFVTKTSIKRI